MRTVHTTYYHMMRPEIEELNRYHLLLQDLGLLTDDIYFNMKEQDISDISAEIVAVSEVYKGFNLHSR